MTALNPVEFLESLVRCYTPSGNEQSAAECISKQMSALGYRDVHIDEIGNAVGSWGRQGAARVFLVGHIDTVEGEIPVRIVKEENREVLYGRGSVDAKGPFATFVSAVSQLPGDIDCEFVVVGAVEEEAATSAGARHLLKKEEQPCCVIIGEPSGTNGITLGYKGRMAFRASVVCSNSHSASQSRSAGDLLCGLVRKIECFRESENVELDGIFPKLDGTVQAISVTTDGFEERGSLSYGFRLGPRFQPETLQKSLVQIFEELRDQVVKEDEAIKDFQIEFYQSEIPTQYSKRSWLAGEFRKGLRKNSLEPRHVLKTGTADMNVLASVWSCEMVAYGPGDSSLDHTPNEHLVLDEYQKAIDVLADTLLGIAEKIKQPSFQSEK